jgi:hypothetical protein
MTEFEARLIEKSGAPAARWKSHAAAWMGVSRPTLNAYLAHASVGNLEQIPEAVLEMLGLLPGQAASQPKPPSVEEMVLSFAVGLVTLQDEIDTHGHPRAPYPAHLQRGLDVASILKCLDGSEYPVTLADLLAVAGKPLYEWCPKLEGPVSDEFYAARLLENFEITRDCLALAERGQQDSEHAFYQTVMDCCEELGSAGQELYEAWRRTVVEVPIASGYTQLLGRHPIFMRQIGVAQRLIDTFYVRMPPIHAEAGKVLLCPSTGTRLRRVGGKLIAELRDDSAQRTLDLLGPRAIDYTPDVLELRRPARLFWSLPGWHELKLMESAKQLGWEVDLWPKLDTVDLVIRKKGSARRFAIDVKDHISAQGLARSFKRFKDYKTHLRFVVIPDYLKVLNPDYVKIFTRARASLGKEKVDLITVSELLKLLKKAEK